MSRFRCGYLAFHLEIAVVVLVGFMTGSVLGAGATRNAAWLLWGAVSVGLMTIPVVVYRRNYVELDSVSGVVRLVRGGVVLVVPREAVTVEFPERPGPFPRSVRVSAGGERWTCPLVQQGQLLSSRRMARMRQAFDDAGIRCRPRI